MEWVGAFGLVAAAAVSGVFAVIGTKLRRENTQQHATNQAKLESIGFIVSDIRVDVRDVRKSQQNHLEWHVEQGAA